MFEQMKWEDVYYLWKRGSHAFPKLLTEPVSAETVYVEYKQSGHYFYGYDWLETEEVHERKQMIEADISEFLYFTKPSNKGTIQTAEMLIEARNEEELAAIWIAATAEELKRRSSDSVKQYAYALHLAAWEFLSTRYYLWHHAMKKLVPSIMIPSSVLENIVCEDAGTVIGLIQMNTVLLKCTWSILRYSSFKDGRIMEPRYRISCE